MTIYILTCWLAFITVECGQYIDYRRCVRAGPYIAQMTALEFGVPYMEWKCEQMDRR
jgi:hypothetical protein